MISLAFFHGKWYNIREIINSRLEDAMYMDFTVKIPDGEKGITRKNIKGTTYIWCANFQLFHCL